MRSILTVLCIVLSLAGNAKAERVDMASSTGSERLVNFAAQQEVTRSGSLPALQTFVQSSARLGFNVLKPDKGIQGLRRTYLNLSPTLNYDANANGGNRAEQLRLGALSLRFDPESLARSAVVAGASLSAGTRLFYGRGRYLDLSAGVGRSFGLGERLVQRDARFGACSRNHLGGWTFVDLCASNSFKQKRLRASDESRVELGITQLLAVSGRPVELRLKTFRQDSAGSWNPGYGAQVLAVVSDSVAVDLSAESEHSSVNAPYERYDVAATLHARLAARQISIRFSQSELSNSRILGRMHDDTRRSITFITPISSKINLNVSYSQTRSPIEFFSSDQFGLALTFSENSILRFIN